MEVKVRNIYKHISDIKPGEKVQLKGWVYRHRDSKKIVFITLRDVSGVMQCTIKDDSPQFEAARKLMIESSVELEGTVVADERSPGGKELQIETLTLIGDAERFPITKDQSTEFLREVRHLWLRSRKMTAMMKIRSTVFGAIDEYFRDRDFYEFQSPCFIENPCEGGSTLFTVDYFGKPAYLTQTWQLHAETAVSSLEKIYTIAPSFRAEKSRTTRHLTEFWHAEMEIVFGGLDEIIEHGEQLIEHICQTVIKKEKSSLEELGRDIKPLEKIKAPFPQITYSEAIDILQKEGMKVEWGKDLRTLEERALAKHYDKPLVITRYPKGVKAFYMEKDPEDARVVLCYDMLAPETGDEIIGGSPRELDIDLLKKRIVAEGEDPATYDWYLDSRRYGAVPHAGFGMGVDRVVQWVTGMDHIQDAIPFPRTMDRISP